MAGVNVLRRSDGLAVAFFKAQKAYLVAKAVYEFALVAVAAENKEFNRLFVAACDVGDEAEMGRLCDCMEAVELKHHVEEKRGLLRAAELLLLGVGADVTRFLFPSRWGEIEPLFRQCREPLEFAAREKLLGLLVELNPCV
jgi:hypothetical protein